MSRVVGQCQSPHHLTETKTTNGEKLTKSERTVSAYETNSRDSPSVATKSRARGGGVAVVSEAEECV